MVSLNVPINLMKVTSAASRNSHSITVPNAAARRTNGNVPMETASTLSKCVTEKPNVLINLMKVNPDAASRTIASTKVKDVVATHNPSGLVPTVTVSSRLNSVTEKPNVLINLMRPTKPAASRTTSSTTIRSADVNPLSSPATQVSAST
jgi:hypothetical protein